MFMRICMHGPITGFIFQLFSTERISTGSSACLGLHTNSVQPAVYHVGGVFWVIENSKNGAFSSWEFVNIVCFTRCIGTSHLPFLMMRILQHSRGIVIAIIVVSFRPWIVKNTFSLMLSNVISCWAFLSSVRIDDLHIGCTWVPVSSIQPSQLLPFLRNRFSSFEERVFVVCRPHFLSGILAVGVCMLPVQYNICHGHASYSPMSVSEVSRNTGLMSSSNSSSWSRLKSSRTRFVMQ